MKVTIEEAKKQIKNAVTTYLSKDAEGNYRMPPLGRLPLYLLGCPGIGKTEVAREAAEELGIGFVSFSLTHHTRNSLLGLPVIRELPDGRKYTEFTMSEIIAAVEKACAAGHKEGIFLLDEFNSVSETILPVMLAFLQTKNIGEFYLPEGWVIILAGNPTEYNRSARALDMALLDRVRKLEIEFDEEVFLNYARKTGFHPAITEFLDSDRRFCYVMDTAKDEREAVTARGWENLSRTMYLYDEMDLPVDMGLVHQFIKSDRVAAAFMDSLTLREMGCSVKEIEQMLAGMDVKGYAEKWSDLPERKLWLLIDYLGRMLSSMVSVKNRRAKAGSAFDHAVSFLEYIENPMLIERLFTVISRDPELVKYLVNEGNQAYRKLCKEVYREDNTRTVAS